MRLLCRPLMFAAGVVLGLTLSGCASVIRLENQVSSFAHATAQPPAAGDTYRFERLPSQQQHAAAQDELEALAQEALGKVGLHLQPGGAPASTKWTVQVSARSLKLRRAPWADPRDDWPHWGGSLFVGRGAYASFGGGLFVVPQPPYYQREVSLVLRRSGGGEVVYETKATQDGPWPDSPALWSVLLDAALDGFPQGSGHTRQVVVEVPR